MNTITVGQLQQDPTRMLADVEKGASYRITRHGREIAWIVPVGARAVWEPAKRPGPAQTSSLPRIDVNSAESLDALIDEMKGDR